MERKRKILWLSRTPWWVKKGVENPAKSLESRKKISERAKKRVFTEERKKKYSEMFKGSNNPNWDNHKLAGENNPAWIDGRSRKPYSAVFKKKIRQQVYERDKFTCQLCKEKFKRRYKSGDKNFITAHHIDYDKSNNELKNLIALCNYCNVSVNNNREDWIKTFVKKMEVKHGYYPKA